MSNRSSRAKWPAFVLTSIGVAAFGAIVVIASGPEPAAAAKDVTFAKDVAPILQRSCQSCHHPGAIGPMSLMTYEDVRPWAKAMKLRVTLRTMPPWFIDRSVGIAHFKDDPSLSDQEIAAISAWADNGAPRGNPSDLPRPRTFDDADRWHIGKPDLIVSMPEEFTVAPQGPDWWGNFVADSGLTEDRYIKAVEAKPSVAGARVVHHAVESLRYDDGTSGEGGTLVEYAPGKNGDVFTDGAGKLMRAGAKVSFAMHYHSIGEEVKDRTQIAFVFYPKGVTPKHVLITTLEPKMDDLDIPAGAKDVRTDGYFKFEKASRMVGFMPHAHNRGSRQCLEVIYPNMTIDQLNCVNYDFNWQIVYNYADDAAPLVPAGTILHLITWHDNTASNRNNPDPRNWIGFGNRTTDDMARHWITYYTMTDDEFKAEVAAREGKKPLSTNQQQQ
jgi:hypothetical protein